MHKRKQGREPAAADRSSSRDPGRHRGRRPPSEGRGQWLFGWHAVTAALANPARKLRLLHATESAVSTLPARRPLEPVVLDAHLLARELPPGAVHQGLALLADPLPELDLDTACSPDSDPASIIVVLDQVTDPHNVGAILRSAAAFGAKALVVTDRHAPEVTGTLAKAASGALEHVPMVRVVNLARALDDLGDLGYLRVGLDSDAPGLIAEVAASGPVAMVLGAEGQGLRRLTRERCDRLVRLPTSGAIKSLNVSNAAAIALYALRVARQA